MASERSVQQKITLGIGLGLLAGSALWLISLLLVASHINSESTTLFTLKFGPFALTTLSKSEVAGGGTIATISLHSGLLWLLLVCASLGGVISASRAWLNRSTDDKLEGRRQSDHQSEQAGRQ